VVASPMSTHSRSHSMYAGSRTPGRRLSVPSSGNPFQSPRGHNAGRPLFGPNSVNSPNGGGYSPAGSVLASPTSSIFSRRDSTTNADEAWRRRTWHPDSSNFNASNASSRLSNVMTPSQVQSPIGAAAPIANPSAQQPNTLRLPGIESFDPIPHRPASPPRRNPSPMMIDPETSHPPTMLPSSESIPEERRNPTNWDMGLHRGLTMLDITSNRNTPPKDSASSWAQEANRAVEAEAERVRMNPPTVRFNEPVVVNNGPPRNGTPPTRGFHQHTMSAPSGPGMRESRRHGWSQGPAIVHSDAPPEKMARVERMVHPNISHFSGFPARAEHSPPQQPPNPNHSTEKDNMLRLQALVAVATSEGSTTTAY
jgi:C2H2 transcription facotor